MSAHTLRDLIPVLRTLGVEEMHFSLSGGGDDGRCDLDYCTMRDGSKRRSLSDILSNIPWYFECNAPRWNEPEEGYRSRAGERGPFCRTTSLWNALAFAVEDAPDFDWINNEGGHGTVTLHPFEDDINAAIVVDMTPGGDEYDEENEDEEDLDEEEEDEPNEGNEIDTEHNQEPHP